MEVRGNMLERGQDASHAGKSVISCFWQNTRQEIEKVMRFLEKELPEEVLEDVYQHTTFQAMRENPMANYSTIPSFVMDHSVSPFMRKGIVGDWRNHFTVAQDEIFEKEYWRKMEGTDLSFRTQL
uniref:Sulfotransferase n=1 Tax=Engystomops pustulosus TaxID=76066 RepID=A0AAV6YNR2_ENGPU|nr:hypothetical protein GDO81_022409 [Engystomops pustulosus]